MNVGRACRCGSLRTDTEVPSRSLPCMLMQCLHRLGRQPPTSQSTKFGSPSETSMEPVLRPAYASMPARTASAAACSRRR